MAESTPPPLEHGHTPEAVAERLGVGPTHSYLHDFVFGAVDGVVTTFAVVAGVAGAGLSWAAVLVLGAANLLADGFSMAMGNFLGTRAERQRRQSLRRIEERHIDLHPDGEREEIRQIYAAKGFSGEQLEALVQQITADRQRWIETMLSEEWGLSQTQAHAGRAAMTTFWAFVAAGALPLVPFLPFLGLDGGDATAAFMASAVLAALAFTAIGAIKGRVVGVSFVRSGAETLAVGACAAAVAYGVGLALKGLLE